MLNFKFNGVTFSAKNAESAKIIVNAIIDNAFSVKAEKTVKAELTKAEKRLPLTPEQIEKVKTLFDAKLLNDYVVKKLCFFHKSAGKWDDKPWLAMPDTIAAIDRI